MDRSEWKGCSAWSTGRCMGRGTDGQDEGMSMHRWAHMETEKDAAAERWLVNLYSR